MAGTVVVPWYATGFRASHFEAALNEVAAAALRYGAISADDRSAKQKTYDLAREFIRRFEGRNGTVICRELLGFDLGTPEGLKQAAAKNTHANVCPRFVRDAAEILQEML